MSRESMEFAPTFLLSVLGIAGGARPNAARMLLIVRRPYAYLEDRLRRAFEGRDDAQILADRRRSQRRMSDRSVQVERRRADRRTDKEEILEVVIHGDPLALFR